MTTDIAQMLISAINNGITAVVGFVPKFVVGLVILLLGIIIASLVKEIVVGIFKALKIENILRKYGVPEIKQEFTWTNIIAQIVRWFVIIVFLIPTTDVWGLPRVVTVLNEFLLYLPNVFVATIIAIVGFVFARLSHDVILASAKSLSADTANTIASITRWAINVFVILAILTQLGVASDLIRILFTGFVAMVAIAGGIAFGLGGQNGAKDIIDAIRKKLK